MTYDLYDIRDGEMLAEDFGEWAAREAEMHGYHGVQGGNIMAVEHGAGRPTRAMAREAVLAEVRQAEEYSHKRNYHRLSVRRDGSVQWYEYADRHSDIIDSQASGFAAVESVACVGTGSNGCNCDYCSNVYDAEEEQTARDRGQAYDREDKFATLDDAICQACVDADLEMMEQSMMEQFAAIPQGYFDGEQA